MPGERKTAVLHRPEYARLGAWLRSRREEAGLSQKAASRALGKPEQYLNKVESGEQRIDVIELIDLAAIIKLDDQMPFGELLKAVGKTKKLK